MVQMIVSGLLTSVGINSALCIVFFALYSVLRKRSSFLDVYACRALAAEVRQHRNNHFNLERLVPTSGWLKGAYFPSEDELLSSSGLDVVVFMRIFIFSLRVFRLAGIIGIFVLLPVNCLGTQIQDVDFSNLANNSLVVFSISNVNNGSKWLWVHFTAVYVVTLYVCYLLYSEYKFVSSKRIEYFYASKPQPHQFTILVRNIPVSVGSSVSESVESFFTEYHRSTYLSHVVVHRTHKLQYLVSEAKYLYRRLRHLKAERTHLDLECDGCCGLFRPKLDLVDQYEKKLDDLEKSVKLEQSDVRLAEEVQAAFVSFKSQYGAACALHMKQSINPTQWLTEQAPEPHDVYWPFFSTSFMQRWISKIMVVVACVLLTILFLIPVVIVQGLANLSQLEVWFPFLTSILSIKFFSQIVTGYLPSLILLMFLKTVPPIMKFLSSIQGYISHSEILRSACNKVLWFFIWNIFFANVLSGSVLNQINIFLEPINIPSKLAVAVPAQASFFIAYVVTSGWTSVSSELFRIFPFILNLIMKPFICCKDEEFEAPSFSFHAHLPRVLLFGLLGITYFFLAPLILPFLLIYFCMGYIIYRNQFLSVYEPKYESGGKYWPVVHNSMIFSLVLMHAIALGIFTLKKLPEASTFIFPLPILTLLFNEYCRKRFLPIFVGFSAESLINKDRQDSNDPTMAEFYSKLVSAYEDPAMLPIRYSRRNSASLSTPLLSPGGIRS